MMKKIYLLPILFLFFIFLGCQNQCDIRNDFSFNVLCNKNIELAETDTLLSVDLAVTNTKITSSKTDKTNFSSGGSIFQKGFFEIIFKREPLKIALIDNSKTVSDNYYKLNSPRAP